MNASFPFGPPINTDIDYYQAYFIYSFFYFFIFFNFYFLVSYAMLVMQGPSLKTSLANTSTWFSWAWIVPVVMKNFILYIREFSDVSDPCILLLQWRWLSYLYLSICRARLPNLPWNSSFFQGCHIIIFPALSPIENVCLMRYERQPYGLQHHTSCGEFPQIHFFLLCNLFSSI